MMHVVSHRIWIKCIVYPLTYQKNAFFAPVFTLRSKVDLILTRAIGPIIAQSAQFSKIVKKLNIDFLPIFFSHWKEALFLLKSWNKIWGSPYSFLRRSCRKCAPNSFFPIFERGQGWVSKWQVCGRGKKSLKNPFLQNLHRDITFGTQCDKDGAWMKIKVS